MFHSLLLATLCAQASSINVLNTKDARAGGVLKKDGSVHIAEWWGRLGNNLIQLQNALIFAEARGKKKVTFPSQHGTELKELLDLPETGIKVDPSNMKKK